MKQEALVGIGDVPAAGDHSSGVHGAVGTVWWLTAAESAVEQWLSVYWLPCHCPSSICHNIEITEVAHLCRRRDVVNSGCRQGRRRLSTICLVLCPPGLDVFYSVPFRVRERQDQAKLQEQ
jgi:hypothetical protein